MKENGLPGRKSMTKLHGGIYHHTLTPDKNGTKTEEKTDTFYLYTIFDQRRVDIIDQVEYGVYDMLTTHVLPVWDLLPPLT